MSIGSALAKLGDIMVYAESLAPVTTNPAVIFDAIPPAAGKSLLTLLLIASVLLGMLIMEFFNHIRYDISLIRKVGWTEPSKCASRLAYFAVRYISIALMALFLSFLTLRFNTCTILPWVYNALCLVLFASMELIFVQRTMALYSWKKAIMVPLLTHYALVICALVACIPFYAGGTGIPGTRFCTFRPNAHKTGTVATIITYMTLHMGLDIILLLLTLNRLLEGGISAVFTKKAAELYTGGADTTLSTFLIRQGFHFYVVQLGCDIVYFITYFGLKDPFLKFVGAVIIISAPSLAAAGAFRDMGRKAVEIGLRNAMHVNEIVNSSGQTPSEGVLGTRVGTNTAASLGGRINPQILSTAAASHKTDGIGHDKTTRISFADKLGGRKKNGFFRTHNDPTDIENINGIVVTVGTVSRTDAIEEEWEADSNPDAIKMTRQWSEPGKSEDGSSTTDKNDNLFEAITQMPTDSELRGDAHANLHPYATQADTVSETGSNAWIPRTPDESVLAPNHFSSPSEGGKNNNNA